MLLDEWQAVPETFPAVKRTIGADAGPGRFLLTGSAYRGLEGMTAAGTGRIVRLRLLGMTVRVQVGQDRAGLELVLAEVLAGNDHSQRQQARSEPA